MPSEQRATKVALVTGASSGIGREVARKLLADGLIVYVAARSLDKMADLATLGARLIRLDVTSKADGVSAIDQIIAEVGRIDILVNNAGFACPGAVEDVPLEDARYQFEVNLFGVAHLTQLVLPQMRKQQSGKIINMSSMGGQIYSLLGAWYHASKHALEGWSDSLRLELAPFGIDVVLIQPGLIRTDFSDAMIDTMLKRSAGGAYETMAERVVGALQANFRGMRSTSPTVVANVVSKAVHANKPRTRYPTDWLARLLMFLRKWLSDRIFDRIISGSMR